MPVTLLYQNMQRFIGQNRIHVIAVKLENGSQDRLYQSDDSVYISVLCRVLFLFRICSHTYL